MADRLAGLREREQLERLVERPEAAWEDDEGLRVAHEHELAREEVVERDAEVDVRVHALLERQQDVEPDRKHPGVARASVGGLHDPRAAAGDHGEPGLTERAGDLPGAGVLGVVGPGAGRAEDADRGSDAGERLEAAAQLALDQAQALGVRARRHHVALLGTDDLLAKAGRRGWCQVLVRAHDYLRESTWKHPSDLSCPSTSPPAPGPSGRSTTGWSSSAS